MAVKVQVRTEADVKALERYQSELDNARKKLITSGKSVDEFTREMRKLDSQQRALNKLMPDTHKGVGKLNDVFGGFVITAGDVYNGAKRVAEELWNVAKEGAEAQKATDTLRFAVERANISWGAHADAIDANIQRVSWLAAVDDEELYVAQSQLLRSTGDLTDSQTQLGLATDISAVTGIKLESVTKALMKANYGNYASLQKLGISVGDVSDSTEAMQVLYEQFGGAASYVNDNLIADADRLGIAWGNLREGAGQAFGGEVTDNVENLALGMNLLNDKVHDGGEKWGLYFSLFGKGIEEQNAAIESFLGLTDTTDKMSSATFRAAQAQQELTAAQTEYTDLQASAEQGSINLARAENSLEDAQKRQADALKEHGAKSREYEDAVLDTRDAELRLNEAREKNADNADELAAMQKEIDKLKSLGAAADYAKKHYGSIGYTGKVKKMQAYGDILPATPGGIDVTAAEAGYDEAFIPINQSARSRALLTETAERMGMTAGPSMSVDLRGATFGAGLTEPVVRGWIVSALTDVVRSSYALGRN